MKIFAKHVNTKALIHARKHDIKIANNPILMSMKSPTAPILLSEKDYVWFEKMLKRNDKRTKLTRQEKELLEGSKALDGVVRAMLDE